MRRDKPEGAAKKAERCSKGNGGSYRKIRSRSCHSSILHCLQAHTAIYCSLMYFPYGSLTCCGWKAGQHAWVFAMVVVGNFRNRAELRKKPRRQFHYNAGILIQGEKSPYPCAIADISETGARLQ